MPAAWPSRRDRLVLGSGILLLSLLLAAQVAAPPAASHPSASPTTASSAAPAGLRLGVVGLLDTLDPLYAALPAERDIDALVFRGLTRTGAAGALVGDLASSWAVTDSGHTYTFHLRNDAVWADGQPVTAADVAYTIRVLQDPAYDGPNGAAWHGVTVSTPDGSTVVLALKDAAAAFLDVTTQPVVPAHLLQGTPVAELPALGFESQPVGDGPYQVTGRDGDTVHLVRAPYQAAAPTTAVAGRAVPAITFQLYPDATTLAAAFRGGDLDGADGLLPDDAAAIGARPGVRALAYPQATLLAAVMNVRVGQPLFRDARVRAALLRAIDRADLVQTVFHGSAAVATTPFPPTTEGLPKPTATAPPFSATAAAAGLTAAGWKHGTAGWTAPGVNGVVTFEVVTVQATANPALNTVAHAVVAAWTSLGLHVTLAELPPTELIQQRLLQHDFSVALIQMDLGRVPDLQPLLTSTQAVKGGTNLAGFQNTQFDALLAAAHGYTTPAVHAQRVAALMTAFAAQSPFLPLVFPARVVVYGDALSGPSVVPLGSPSDRFWDILDWRLAP